MTSPDPLATILTEAERQRRADRAASASANTVSTPASTGDYTVDVGRTGTVSGNVVVLDANGYIPSRLLNPADRGGAGGGGARVYDHAQPTAASTWTIPHFLGGYPPVVALDAAGNQVHAEVHYPDDNHVVLKWGRARSGYAHLCL